MEPVLKIEVEIRIEPDGSVVFMDMEKGLLPVREALAAPGDEGILYCVVPQQAPPPATASDV